MDVGIVVVVVFFCGVIGCDLDMFGGEVIVFVDVIVFLC